MSYDANQKTWNGSYTIQPTDEEGTWVLVYGQIIDNAGNSKNFYESDLVQADMLEFTVK